MIRSSDQRPRLALLADPREEDWPSMDLVAEMLASELQRSFSAVVSTELVTPRMTSIAGAVPGLRTRRAARNMDRIVTRFGTYPARVLPLRRRFEYFHVADHSYAQLVHALPGERTGVYCHDLDAFRCLTEPAADRRPRWFQWMSRAVLRGMQRAAIVFYSTQFVRREIERHGLIDPSKLVHAPFGIAQEFSPEPCAGDRSAEVLLPLGGRPYVLHVGSEIARKRIDVVLRVFAGLKRRRPDLMLVQQNAALTPSQRALVDELGLGDALLQPPRLSRATVAGLYRGASLVLLPSEAEGFGFPLIEALACAAPVLVSDIPVLREVGGDAALYGPVGDVEAWVQLAGRMLDDPHVVPPRDRRRGQAAKYSWNAHAHTILAAYRRLDGLGPPGYPHA